MTVEDLGEKPEPIKQAKFEYSSFGENFKKQIKTIKEKQETLKEIKDKKVNFRLDLKNRT